jgi:hypothetical protein
VKHHLFFFLIESAVELRKSGAPLPLERCFMLMLGLPDSSDFGVGVQGRCAVWFSRSESEISLQ